MTRAAAAASLRLNPRKAADTMATQSQLKRRGGRKAARIPGSASRSGPALRTRLAAPTSQSQELSPPGAAGHAGDPAREVLQRVLTATYWLDPGDSGLPCTAVIRFTGHRAGVTGALSPGDRFEQVEMVEGLLPGSGPVAVTTRVQGINPGKWLVRGVLVSQHSENRELRPWVAPVGTGRLRVRRLLWSKGNPVRSARPGTGATTRMAAFVTVPGVIAGSWPGMVAAGLVAARSAT